MSQVLACPGSHELTMHNDENILQAMQNVGAEALFSKSTYRNEMGDEMGDG